MHGRVELRKASVLIILVAVSASRADAQPPSYRGPPPAGQGSSSDRRVQFAIAVMRRMDANRNGVLEREELSDRARPYIERYARLARLDVSRPLPIPALERAVHQYYSHGQGQPSGGPGSPPVPTGEATVPGFGQVDNLPPVPGFGTDPESSVKVEPRDLATAADRLRQYDSNRDGFIDRNEARRGRWSDDPFQYDKNGDGRLSQNELAERYAVRRLREANRDNRPSSSSSRPPSDQRPQGPPNEEQRRREEEQRRREEEERRRRQYGGNRESWRLTGSLMGRYDLNRDGGLDRSECRAAGISPAAVDTDDDGRINPRELSQWLAQRSNNSSQDLLRGLPGWFSQRDANGDGQVVMAEFTEEWTDAKAAEFARYDINQDGIIMPEECLKAMSLPGGTHSNHRFQIIPARGTLLSEIVVQDDATIENLDVQLSITHTWDECLDGFLVGPDGQRVELFTSVGGSDDHFENTVFDDESAMPITHGRPPFSGRYQPEAVAKRQPGLKHFSGKKMAGTWTLVIRAERSERSGALHGWSLINAPAVEPAASEPPESGSDDSDSEPAESDFRSRESDMRRRYWDSRRRESESRPGEGEFRRPPFGGRPGEGEPRRPPSGGRPDEGGPRRPPFGRPPDRR